MVSPYVCSQLRNVDGAFVQVRGAIFLLWEMTQFSKFL